MSYRKKVKRKIKKTKIMIRFFPCIILLLIVFGFYFKGDNKIEEYEQKILYLQQIEKSMTNIESIDNLEIKTYYVSANGTSSDGTDINNPMSLATANNKIYYGNEKVLFKCGDIFYGTINFNVQASQDEMFYIGSYGEGEKPIISGANIVKNREAWQLDENGIYKIDLSNYSNFEGIGETYLDLYNIGFIADKNGNIYGSRKNTKQLLTNENDFYCENNYLYIKSNINPNDKFGEVKMQARNNLVNISSNTIVTNLNIQNTGAHGIVKKNSKIENVYVKDCIIQNIGGSVLVADTFTRYGNGLEFWNNASNTLVEGCIFRNIYDAGYTMQGNTVTTGFENNICQNNIFINCTYTYETFCRNKNDSSIEIYMKGQKFINNISIDQGKGWGYEVRPDKKAPAEFIIWTIPIESTDIEISKNMFWNSRMLQFKSSSYNLSIEDYKECVNSDNNKIYLSQDTYLINNTGNYQDKTILQEYGIEQNSTFRLLTNQDLTKINNTNILTSNDYTEIKTYYETLEKDFTYTDAITPIQEKYTQFKQQNQTTITTAGLATKITQLETYLQQANSTNTTQENLTQQINQTYELGTTILTTYLNNNLNITEGELLSILQQINEIGQTYNTLYSLLQTQETVDFTNIQNQIAETEQVVAQYQQIGLTQVTTLISNSKTAIQSELQDTIKSTAATYLVDWAQKLLDIDIINYINQNPPDLTYSTTSLTNKDVTVTMTTNYYIQITNNNGSPTYTFTKNGSFTFQYTVRNKQYTVTAMVTNIDKTPPTITGLEEGELYYIEQEIVPQITDTHLKEVALYINGVQIDYDIGQPLIVEGIYKIVATDEAGNTKTVQFQVMEKPEEKYIMQENSIQNIKYSTTKAKFDAKVKIQETYTIERKTENETIQLKSTDTIASGDILTTESGQKYTLIVAGDLTKDGLVDIQDFVRMRRYLLGLRELDEVETLAADANVDSKDLSISDYIRIRILILNQLAGI